jgi:hypothetical protein
MKKTSETSENPSLHYFCRNKGLFDETVSIEDLDPEKAYELANMINYPKTDPEMEKEIRKLLELANKQFIKVNSSIVKDFLDGYFPTVSAEDLKKMRRTFITMINKYRGDSSEGNRKESVQAESHYLRCFLP